MTNPTPQRVTCPSCDKGYRWQPSLVGRRVPCKQCGNEFEVPDAPGKGIALELEPIGEDGTYDLDFDPVADAPASPANHAAPANSGKCPSCNSPVREGAVLCMNCGFNMQEGKKIQAPAVTALPEKEKKTMRRELSGMKWVRVGFWLNLLSILLIVLILPVAFGAVAADLDADLITDITDIMILLSIAIGFAGGVLCLAAPKQSKARPVAIVSLLLGIASATITILMSIDVISESHETARDILGQLESIGFLYFFVVLARYLEFDQITERAQKVLWLYITLAVVLAGSGFLAILPLIGCIALIFLLCVAVYTFFLYIGLLIDLNNALTHHIHEQSD